MKLAAMIIAHKNADQLIRLIQSLKDPDIDVFVHLDKKWKLSESEIDAIRQATPYVTVIEKRISGFLDTWSLCEIALELAKGAFAVGREYAYYMLLSGQDYPIKSVAYIKEYLVSQHPKPLIDCTPLRKDNWIYSGFKWIRFHWYYRLVERITRRKWARKLLLLPAYAVQAVVTVIMRPPYKRLKKQGVELYGGSAWWILPHEVIQKAVELADSNSAIVKAFRLKNTPEETYFQTVVMNSDYRDMVEVNDPYEVLQNCMTYAYFFDDTHTPTGHPYVLQVENFKMLLMHDLPWVKFLTQR